MIIDISKILWRALANDENKFIRTLVSARKGVQDAVTYSQINELILTHQIPVEIIQKAQQEYAKWLSNDLREYYKTYARAGAMVIAEKFRKTLNLDRIFSYVDTWILTRGADLVTKINEDTRLAIRTILHKFVVEEPKSAEELSQYIRSVVGLTERQTIAVIKLKDALIEQGETEVKAMKAALRYAEELHRFRARMIARTELSFAYNQASLMEMADIAVEEGYEIKKTWITAPDEKVCEQCGNLDGTTIGLFEMFYVSNKQITTPPAHPNCRCSLTYEIK